MSGDLTQATVFYSWESDLHGKTTRNLIEGCLNTAIRQLGREDDLDVVPSLDRDTKGVSGSPVILDAILEKIDNCTAFVADVSIINSADVRRDPPARPTPNPNVSIELGYAIKSCGWDRILPVCNDFYGPIDQLPFDIPERRVISYTLSQDPTPEEVKAAKERLAGIFKSRLKDILKLTRQSILDIQFCDLDTEQLLGHELECSVTLVEFSDVRDHKFPKSVRNSGPFGGIDPLTNSNYFEEVGKYTFCRNLTQRVAFAITNNSSESLKSPRLEIKIDTPDFPLAAYDEESFPDEPSYSVRLGRGFRSALAATPPNWLTVKTGEEQTIIRAELESIQAKRTAWTSCCFLGTTKSPEITLKCRIFADNLPQPFEQQLTMRFNVGEQSKTLQEWIDADFLATLVEMPEPTEPAE
ncbi:MAG: hypothetical protein H6822_24615 [Planctomycetaceae bacterium]|nr:hypothetical protein [Planctomycetales bacterium]MCB9925385.1 hypothetical protein [Planctomycetaceae bacterium]